jgi:hypothetical protein
MKVRNRKMATLVMRRALVCVVLEEPISVPATIPRMTPDVSRRRKILLC